MKSLITISAIVMASFIACSNNKNGETTSADRQVATDSNAAVSQSATPALPVFSVMDVKGNTLNLQNLKGKKVFVNLWASWCPPCKREMPSIEKLYHSIDTTRVAFVILSLDDRFEKAMRFVQSRNLKLPIYYPAENLPELFNVQGIPSTFIFDENGKMIKRVDGGDDYDTEEYRNLLK